MKKFHFLVFVLVIGAAVLSACGAAPATPAPVGGGKAQAIPVAFIGVVDSIAGDQWVINGKTVTVALSVVREGPFNPGDSVKVEGTVNPDGSLTVSRVESPSAEDISTLPQFGNGAPGPSNTNDANSNVSNLGDANVNADNTNSVISNDNGSSLNANTNGANGNDSNSNDDHGDDDDHEGDDDHGNSNDD
jgi:hypothetical protein